MVRRLGAKSLRTLCVSVFTFMSNQLELVPSTPDPLNEGA